MHRLKLCFQAIVTAMQSVDGISRQAAEDNFAAGVRYTAEEMKARYKQLYVCVISALVLYNWIGLIALACAMITLSFLHNYLENNVHCQE